MTDSQERLQVEGWIRISEDWHTFAYLNTGPDRIADEHIPDLLDPFDGKHVRITVEVLGG